MNPTFARPPGGRGAWRTLATRMGLEDGDATKEFPSRFPAPLLRVPIESIAGPA